MAFWARNPRQTTNISAETFLANHRSLGIDAEHGSIPGGRRLRCLNFAKQLVEDPDEAIVVFTTKDLRDKGAPFNKEFHCELQAHKDEL